MGNTHVKLVPHKMPNTLVLGLPPYEKTDSRGNTHICAYGPHYHIGKVMCKNGLKIFSGATIKNTLFVEMAQNGDTWAQQLSPPSWREVRYPARLGALPRCGGALPS